LKDLTTDAGVGAALDLDEGGDSVLIEEMVDGPTISAAFLSGDAGLPADEEPPSSSGRLDLSPASRLG
jgi:hypothetical protein